MCPYNYYKIFYEFKIKIVQCWPEMSPTTHMIETSSSPKPVFWQKWILFVKITCTYEGLGYPDRYLSALVCQMIMFIDFTRKCY